MSTGGPRFVHGKETRGRSSSQGSSHSRVKLPKLNESFHAAQNSEDEPEPDSTTNLEKVVDESTTSDSVSVLKTLRRRSKRKLAEASPSGPIASSNNSEEMGCQGDGSDPDVLAKPVSMDTSVTTEEDVKPTKKKKRTSNKKKPLQKADSCQVEQSLEEVKEAKEKNSSPSEEPLKKKKSTQKADSCKSKETQKDLKPTQKNDSAPAKQPKKKKSTQKAEPCKSTESSIVDEEEVLQPIIKLEPPSKEDMEDIYKFAGLFRQSYSPNVANVVAKLNEAAQKSKLLLQADFKSLKTGFSCSLCVKGVFISTGLAESKKVAKSSAYDAAANILLRPYLSVHFDESLSMNVLQSSNMPESVSTNQSEDPDMIQLGKKTASNIKTLARAKALPKTINQSAYKRPAATVTAQPAKKLRVLSNEIVVYEVTVNDSNNSPISTLTSTCSQNKVALHFAFRKESIGTVCNITIGGESVASATASNATVAKRSAAAAALETLKQNHWTLEVKGQADTTEDSITQETIQLSDGAAEQGASIHKPISTSNIGSKLLQQMGWQGGGLKPGAISEPVPMTTTIRRQGLGLSSASVTDTEFLEKIRTVLLEYQTSTDQHDIKFSCEFSKEQRAKIHKAAQKMNLQTKSCGQGDERYLIVSRKRSFAEILAYVRARGGETEKYKLIPPTFL